MLMFTDDIGKKLIGDMITRLYYLFLKGSTRPVSLDIFALERYPRLGKKFQKM